MDKHCDVLLQEEIPQIQRRVNLVRVPGHQLMAENQRYDRAQC